MSLLETIRTLIIILEGGESPKDRDFMFLPENALCSNIIHNAGLQASKDFTMSFKTWEHSSGCNAYPVPLTDDDVDLDEVDEADKPEAQFQHCDEGQDFYYGEQGKLRLSLLKHALKYFQDKDYG